MDLGTQGGLPRQQTRCVPCDALRRSIWGTQATADEWVLGSGGSNLVDQTWRGNQILSTVVQQCRGTSDDEVLGLYCTTFDHILCKLCGRLSLEVLMCVLYAGDAPYVFSVK